MVLAMVLVVWVLGMGMAVFLGGLRVLLGGFNGFFCMDLALHGVLFGRFLVLYKALVWFLLFGSGLESGWAAR